MRIITIVVISEQLFHTKKKEENVCEVSAALPNQLFVIVDINKFYYQCPFYSALKFLSSVIPTYDTLNLQYSG